MTTWQTIFGVDPPVRGVLSEFSGARDTFESMRSDAQTIVDQFAAFADPSFAEGNLNEAPGQVLAEILSQADGGLQDLPRVAGEAHGIFSDHYDALVGFRDRSDEALALAVTNWNRKNELLEQQSGLQSQIDDVSGQIDDAAADADTSTLDTDLSGFQSTMGGVSNELSTVQGVLDGIYGKDESTYNAIVADETSRNETTRDCLDDIDLGDLEDPGFWDKVGSFLEGIGDFLGGILESIANLLEAFVTGDWATFFWELKSLLEAALLILGTIALFTGIGGPLGLLLIGLAVASLAVNTGLYLTQTPNPQTGQTVGLFDVAMSAVSVVFAGASVFQAARMTSVFNRGIQSVGMRAGQSHGVYSTVQRSWYQTFRIANAPGLRNGALPQFFGNLGRSANNGMTSMYNMFNRSSQIPYRFAPGTNFLSPLRGASHQPSWFTTVGSPASWEVVSTPITPDGLDFGNFGTKLTAGGFDGFNVANAPGWTAMLDFATPGDMGHYGSEGEQGTPLFGPPDACIVPAR